MKRPIARAFTIVELLVVVSIIALLIGILLPAIGKARDTAKVGQSKSNIRNVMVALQQYAATWNGTQFTAGPPNLSAGDRAGMQLSAAIGAWASANGAYPYGNQPLGIVLGEIPYGGTAAVAFWNATSNHPESATPYTFQGGLTTSDRPGLGTWRFPNAAQVAEYLDGDLLNKAYFAPKDLVVLRELEVCFEFPATFCPTSSNPWGITPRVQSNMILVPSSYTMSPAAMFHPAVFARDAFKDPMSIPSGFRSPTIAQAQHSSLKSWLMEHHWLQNRTSQECGLNWGGTWFLTDDGGYGGTPGCWNGCEPFHFNHSYKSAPVTAYYDMHTGTIEMAEAERMDDAAGGIWSRDTGDGSNGYWMDRGSDWTAWSGHVLTTDGIKGRDFVAK